MGTRGLYGFINKAKTIGSYNHYDSYPSELGKNIIEFLKTLDTPEKINQLSINVGKLKSVTTDMKPTSSQINKCLKLGLVDINVSTGSLSDWYCLLRNAQNGENLKLIFEGKLPFISDDTNFINNSIFCKYTYLINLDTNNLDVYHASKNVLSIPFEDIHNHSTEKLVELMNTACK